VKVVGGTIPTFSKLFAIGQVHGPSMTLYYAAGVHDRTDLLSQEQFDVGDDLTQAGRYCTATRGSAGTVGEVATMDVSGFVAPFHVE
jgi:hypothetical protein